MSLRGSHMRVLFRQPTTGGATEFYIYQPENLLLVKKERGGGVLICATADNLTTEQREAFVRYLSVEGFVSGVLEASCWFQESVPDREGQSVRWIIDPSWPEIDPAYAKHIQRLCWCMAGTMTGWLALMIVLACC